MSSMMDDESQPCPFGVDACTGMPLSSLSEAAIKSRFGIARLEEGDSALADSLSKRQQQRSGLANRLGGKRAIVGGGDGRLENKLEHTGWGVVYGPTIDQEI